MGRESGFIAAGATLASQEVNFCLIPEQPFTLEGPNGFLKTLERRLASRQHAVVVVAEGAGQDLVATSGVDKSGNKKLGDIGVFMKEQIIAYFKGINMPTDVKYFDPSYYIRSGRANSNDAILCDQYARLAVHAAMAGKTNVVIGLVGDSFTHLPISLATSQRKQVNVEGALWRSVIACTGQPFRWS
jgi:6-phosphofructokinase 1